MKKLYVSAAMLDYDDPWNLMAVVADSREEAIERVREVLQAEDDINEQYRNNMLANLDSLQVVESGVFIDWEPGMRRRRR